MPSYAYPPPPSSAPPTAIAELDAIVDRVASNKGRWALLPIADKLAYLDDVTARWEEVSDELVRLHNQAKGLDPSHPAYDEDTLSGTWAAMRNFPLLRRNLEHLARTGQPRLPGKIWVDSTGRTVARVFPGGLYDRLLLAGISGEVVMQPGVTPDNLADHTASAMRHPDPNGCLQLVLGAGNVMSIPPMDSVYKLFVENSVVVLKMNPVNDYAGPLMARVFGKLVADGFFEVVYGGAEVGHHLCTHPKVDMLHITGSDATHDAIVWGPREGRAERKAKGQRANDKPISSELGNVTPVIVVPGKWTERELDFQAWNIVTMVTNNASFNCVAGKLLVMAEGWPQRQALLERIRKAFGEIPPRKAYYPGARSRWSMFVERNPQAERIGADDEQVVPWTLIPGVAATDVDNPSFTTEPFCAVLSEVALPYDTPAAFLQHAVTFCNEVVWGQLSAGILVDPRTHRDPATAAAVERAIAELRYGTVALNLWPALPYAVTELPWGAFPGNTVDDVGSGIGVVHNAYLFDKPEKGVLRGPFTAFPYPPWFANHKSGAAVGRLMTRFEAHPSPLRLIPVALNALRS